MKHMPLAYVFSLMLLAGMAHAGDVAVTLIGTNPLMVSITGTSSDQEAGSVSLYLYFRDDDTTELDIADVDDDQLETTWGWSDGFRTQEVQTGSWYRSGHTFTRRLFYDNAGIDSLDDYWSTGGVTALTCAFGAVGDGHVYVEPNGFDGLADWSGYAHTVSHAIPPDTPELHITGLSPTQCQLWWHPVAGATSYNLFRGTFSSFSPGTAWQTVAAPDTIYTFSDGVGDPATTYYFVCRSVGPGGEWGDSDRVGEQEFSLP